MLGCSTDMYHHDLTLDEALDGEEQVAGNVIACAASNEDDGLVSVFFYQRDGASNVKYYETESADVDKDDFENYYRIDLSATDVFNGYLKKFEVAAFEEKWVIVTFEEAGKVHLSNPIRLKHETRPTEYLPQNVYVDDGEPGSPVFTWDDGTYTDSEIYFQVVSDAQGNLLSGTYTLENRFQFYNLDNVVLNITEQPPSALKSSSAYTFTLLAVSADNWVNLYSEIDFRAK
ncbi:hypothetical protein SAMN04488513_101956 [Pseudozobellia thermophila]|uniref:Uncharacterized protein n=2 Tax=Pseudozobellia thermophila TaxID=192903 RepID=A0A1M6D254_9FLAO|nr:hypothetical protein SAMN04488513_101956 [Pseudozobellia thermophila]